MLRRLGVLYHPNQAESSDLAETVRRAAVEAGLDVWRGAAHDESALRQAAPDLDVLVTLGGDGTIVRAVRAVAEASVPILGVNLGRLGFLAEIEPTDLPRIMPSLLSGAYALEERMMLHTELQRAGETVFQAEAINDAVLARGARSRTVRVSVDVDGVHVMSPTADGIIVSTPTGSTAYCLAAGGPIVAPDLRCLVITPIAAHLGIVKAFVIPPERTVCLTLTAGEDATLTIDGQIDVRVALGDMTCSTASRLSARFVRLGEAGYYYETVLNRLGWADRPAAP